MLNNLQMPVNLPSEPSLAAANTEGDEPEFDAAALRQKIAGCATPDDLLPLLKAELKTGRSSIKAQFEASGSAQIVLRDLSGMMDALIAGTLDFAARNLYRLANPTRGEEFSLLAVGGYGRGELAPGSDIDLLILHPYKRSPHIEQMAEFLLYKLWDMGLKVGQATRSVDETVKLAKSDLTIETSLLETRLIWGSARLAEEMSSRFRSEVCDGRGADFIEGKLAERDARHERMGDTRYHLEPNLKEGKGGLRDLQTLMWLGRHLYGANTPKELVDHGVLDKDSLKLYLASRKFLWTVRCHLHYLTGRAEERLTFDLQPAIAEKMNYRDNQRRLGVERFMMRYYLVLKNVGALTRIVCAALEDQHKRKPRFGLPRFGLGRRKINGFGVNGNRLVHPEDDLFEREPVKIIELFRTSQQENLDIHPATLQAVSRNLSRINHDLREDPVANELFLQILTDRSNPAVTLVRMNEAGVIGRFVPDFGQIVALMQHNLYHCYTVDEHTIQALQILHHVETGAHEDELPLATGIMPSIQARTELYVAMFIHDLGKGRGGDHSTIGAKIAKKLCPRLGLSPSSTETVAWLVQHHLVMSDTAFKRDVEDPKTIQDFVGIVQSPERLKLLLVLTVADIRAVGPTIWNGWKGQLLRELYAEAEAALNSTDTTQRRQLRIEDAKSALRNSLKNESGWTAEVIEEYLAKHDPRYWLGVTPPLQLLHAQLVRESEDTNRPLNIDFRVDTFRARTEMTVYAADHPGLFMRVAGALALAGTSIVDAHIFTTSDGMALDSIGLQDSSSRQAVSDRGRLSRIERYIARSLEGELWLEKELAGRRNSPKREDVFQVEPRVFINNAASRTHTLVEVNARDRPGLLFDVATALKNLGLAINSAHISTYGERVVDVFYVKDVFGMKIQHPGKQKRIREKLIKALAGS